MISSVSFACLLIGTLIPLILCGEFNWTVGSTSVVLSSVAYCSIDVILNREYVDAQGFIVKNYFIEAVYDTQGYIGVMPSEQAIYIIFRGSESIDNWLVDIDTVLTTYPYCSDCLVHKGFYSTEQAAYSVILDALQPVINEFSGYSIVVTGHSLGAALATLLAVDLIKKEGLKRVVLMNFGSPRVGNDKMATFLSNLISNRSRVTHYKDTVPHLPNHTRFTHISGEWYEDGENGGELKECSGYEDTTCSYQWTITSITDHMHYLGVYMSCPDS